jgi:hypothetical protein
MFPHHAQTLTRLTAAFQEDPTVLAVLLGGSIAHGFARPDSDVDISLVVSAEEFARRQAAGLLHYNNRSLCAYDGYIDGKYMDLAFLETVAQRGSDPARYAFEGNQVLFSRLPGLEQVLARIVRFPTDETATRRDRFGAQLLAWRWYYSEALRQDSAYLRFLALHKIVLFSTRLVLNHNQLLFPYHKWMLRVLAAAPSQPPGMVEEIQALLAPVPPRWEQVDAYCRRVLAFVGVDFAAADAVWPTHFMKDTELRWTRESATIDDL